MHFVHWPVSGITVMIKSLISSQPMQAFDHYLLLCEGTEQHLVPFKEIIRKRHAISPKNSVISNMLAVPRILKRWKPDLVHSHSFQPSLFSALWMDHAIPHLRTIHSPYPYFSSSGYSAVTKRTFERWSLTRPNTQTIAVSPKASKQAQKTYRLAVETIFNGIDDEIISMMTSVPPVKSFAEDLVIKREGRKVLVSCGRLHPEKGFDLLLQAFYKLTKDYDNLMLWLIGEGQQRSELTKEIKRLGLSEQVILLGYQENPYWYLAQADIYVASSYYEGFSLATVEALSLGLPVVVAPSIVESLELNDEVAICLSSLSAEEIILGVKQLLDDRSLTKKLEQAATGFSKRYSVDVTAECYAKKYNAMLS